MRNRFNLNEEEKNRIRGLHNINEQNMASNMGSGFSKKQGSSDTLNKFKSRQNETQDIEELNYHEFKEEDFTSKRGYDRDYEKRQSDLSPGENPKGFYGDDSLDKLRKFAKEQDSEMSKEEMIKNLLQIKGLIVDESPEMAIKRISLLLGELGYFKD